MEWSPVDSCRRHSMTAIPAIGESVLEAICGCTEIKGRFLARQNKTSTMKVVVKEAEIAHASLEHVERSNPADVSKHLEYIEGRAAKTRIVEDHPPVHSAPGRRTRDFDFHDGSTLRVELTKLNRDIYRYTRSHAL
jgi:hypothetical protein